MLDNLVFVIGGAGSGGLEGIGIGLSYSSSSESIKFDDVAREKSIAVAFREIALLVISAAPVTDRRDRLLSVPPPGPLFPLSETERKESRSPTTTVENIIRGVLLVFARLPVSIAYPERNESWSSRM
jgi:hypothetical protein